MGQEEPIQKAEPAASTASTSNLTGEQDPPDAESFSDHSSNKSPTHDDEEMNDEDEASHEQEILPVASSASEPAPAVISSSSSSTKPRPKKKGKKPIKYCKAPQAPKRFKSAFIFFTMARHSQIRKKLEAEGAADSKVRLVYFIIFSFSFDVFSNQ